MCDGRLLPNVTAVHVLIHQLPRSLTLKQTLVRRLGVMQCKALRALRGLTTGRLQARHWFNQKVQSVNEDSFLLRRGPKQAKYIKQHYI